METTRPEQVVVFMEHQNTSTKDKHPETEHNNKDQITGEEKPVNPVRKTQTLRGLNFSKPKSRFVELNHPLLLRNNTIHELNYEDEEPSIKKYSSSSSSSDEDEDVEEEEEEEDEEEEGGGGGGHMKKKKKYRKKKKKIITRMIIEWVLFFIIMTCLICSLTITSLKQKRRWGLEIWKWCLMVLVVICGRLVSGWLMAFAVFLIERNFMLRERVLYFLYGLRKSIQNCVWLGLVLLAWTCLFNAKVHKKNKVLKRLFRAQVAILIGATIWMIKIVLVKMLASSFHVTNYFDRMKESVFHHYILDTLSGPPMDVNECNSFRDATAGMRRKKLNKMRKVGLRKIDMEELRKLSTEKMASAWSVKRLVNYIRYSGLSTISKTVDEFGKAESEIRSEMEARSCAQRIFKNVAKPGAKYIEEEDLSRFLKRIEVHTIYPLFEGALKTGRITKSSFRNWVVRAYLERKSLAHSLNDTKTAVRQLHKLASAIVGVIIIVVSLLVMGVATTKVIVFVITQLILIGFMFQNTCKTIFESIIFVFVMHPFDIGDRCVVDGVQMVVEEMNILTTVFLRYDMEKIYYPNSILITKPISNFYRSPEMGDAIDFTIDVSTSIETIVALKKAIQIYVESKPKHWSPKHTVIMKEIENLDKLKMCLCVHHTINHQNYGEKNNRISELILELKNIFESLRIKYSLLPQEVHLINP